MHSLLERQIRKFLKKEEKGSQDIQGFIKAIDRSYHNYEDQFSMLQRAMSISSQELFEANEKLKKEANQQKKVITRLTDATHILQSITVKNPKGKNKNKELTGVELAILIEKQATQISEVEKQREVLLKDLEKSNKELNEYANIVSHDLKSPLRSINTLINWIKEDAKENLDPNIRNNLDLIDQNIEKMDNLITGILEYSVINNKSRNQKSDVQLIGLIEEILQELKVPKHIQINTQAQLPVVLADRSRIKQIFKNLLINAIQSIDKEKGVILILFEETSNFWKFNIKDNGKGIAKKYHDKIFQIFQTLDDQKKSTGIGLPIVKKIVEFYNGKIWLESQEEIGSTFYFTLKK
ncbi:sensor histidine kinase [Aquimarina muelleri]|uniref:histidine kinase n=1 Tax=Aquimarina muelleri TaxID=279356 RepID=A0A918N3R2_9FLAO|nr:ATP-binding protein [Aquimarina muelleri]MCX2762564.1 ATP-binding protein [Aquimarina muelleri]GGX24170.1 two-component sensor histidine kinase [Aquimarina muelleri]